MPWKSNRNPVLRYGVALLYVVAALVIVFCFGTWRGLGTLFFFAVLLSAWYGGLGPGLFSTALIMLLGLALPGNQARGGTSSQLQRIVSVSLFSVGGVLITLIIEALHSARRRAEEITEESHRHQETLRQSEARLESILSNSPSVVTMKDTEGRYLMVNRRFETLFHVKSQGVVGKTDLDLFPATTAELFRRNDQIVMEAREPMEFEEEIPQEGGSLTYLTTKFLLFAADGAISAICGKSTDITHRKRTEEQHVRLVRQAALRADVGMALAMNESSLPGILEHCAAAEVRHLGVALARLWTLDARGNTLVLQAEAGLGGGLDGVHTGISPGGPLLASIIRDRQPQWSNQLVNSGLIDPHDPLLGAGIIAYAAYPLIVEDRLLGVMALFDRHPFEADTLESLAALADVIAQGIERKRLEVERDDLLARERAARAEAESANQAKDQFLAVLSHELRTPLTPILASVSALLAEPGTPTEIRTVLELTQWGIELESRLIDDLLDMTRIIRGRFRLDRESIDAHGLIHRALEICREEIAAGGVAVVLDLSAAGHHVEADPVRLEQVFWNLIKNAVKFSPGGGTLTVRTRNEPRGRIVAGPNTTAADVIVEVSDTGIGIEPETLPVIFNAFTQGEAGRVRRFGGLGLGLAISRSVMEAHGGRIDAASAGSGRGSTFTVSLATIPEPSPKPACASPPASSRNPVRQLKILLVEDDGPTLKVMTRLLDKPPYVVKTANTYASAFEIATSEDFDLIISDIGLPDGSGLELMRQIRDRYIARGIAMSGYGMEEDIRKSREAGFLAHLTKPVDFQKLQVAIEQVTATLG